MQVRASEIIGKVIEILEPLDAETRQRALAAVQAYFGDRVGSAKVDSRLEDVGHGAPMAVSAKALHWMKQNGLSSEDLEKVYHVTSDGAEFIAGTVPGKSKKEQTFNAYILLGIAKYLISGEPNIDDKEARELCVSLACYDPANHATNFKDRGNDFAGTKERGWTLTAPGLRTGANLIKELAQA